MPSWPARSGSLQGENAATASAESCDTSVAQGQVETASYQVADGATTEMPKQDTSTGTLSAEAEPKRKRARGQNKGRQFARMDDDIALCANLAKGHACEFADTCKFSHDLCAYLTHKPRDIPFIAPPADKDRVQQMNESERSAYLDALYAQAVASETPEPTEAASDPIQHSLRDDTQCPYFRERGACPIGWKCRFLGAHVRRVSPSKAVVGDEAQGMLQTGLELVVDDARYAAYLHRPSLFAHRQHADNDEVNWLPPGVARSLRTKKYVYEKAPVIVSTLQQESQALQAMPPSEAASTSLGKGPLRVNYALAKTEAELSAALPRDASPDTLEAYEDALRNARDGSDAAADTARVRPSEKRRLRWHGDLYLAPLTTTGNLPFRRLCASFGSDIHCGEMGMAEAFTQGHASEWSLVRRWEGERIFGTQICGAKPDFLVPAAEVLAREVGAGLDFVDVNCGCPIDLVYNKGAGSALLDHVSKLGRIVRGMSEALGEIPLTIKLRTGTTAKLTTHKIFARAQTEWGVGGITLHGRSRKQRYKNDANWDYIRTCADTLRESVRTWNEESRHADEPEMAPIPIYGNGDVYGWRDYEAHMTEAHVDGTMIARGALIKPWIFTEIKERRDWDISSRERLDMVRQFASYGLTHWGADTQGINTTRRFLCEMLSFTHRYVPLGVLEHVPVRMNDRPPPFEGRDPLETLLSSPSAQDWTRIADMFLGPAPDNWRFTRTYTFFSHAAKHKSNSFDDASESQG